MLAAIGLGIGAWLLFRYDENPRPAPDSDYYLHAAGKRAPVPFCFRPMLPAMLAWADGDVWVAVTFLGIVLQSLAMYQLTGSLAGSLLLLGLPAGARFSVRHPVLVDAFALGWTLFVAANWEAHYATQHPLWQGATLLVLACFREQAPILLACLIGNPWIMVATPSAMLLTRVYFGRELTDQEARSNPWLARPWYMAHLFHGNGKLFQWSHAYGGLGLILPLAMATGPWPWQAWTALAMGVLPAVRASDHGRAMLWAAPVLILLAVQAPVSAAWWPTLLLLHWFNPYRGG